MIHPIRIDCPKEMNHIVVLGPLWLEIAIGRVRRLEFF